MRNSERNSPYNPNSKDKSQSHPATTDPLIHREHFGRRASVKSYGMLVNTTTTRSKATTQLTQTYLYQPRAKTTK